MNNQHPNPAQCLQVVFISKIGDRSLLVARTSSQDFSICFFLGGDAFLFKKEFNRLMYRIEKEEWIADSPRQSIIIIPGEVPESDLKKIVEQYLAGEPFDLHGYDVREDYSPIDEDWIY